MKDTRERFTLKHFDNIEISDDPTYLVKDILPDIGLAVIYGPEKCGKSFWLFDLLMHVALGWEYRGHDVRPGPIVYLALEGGRGFAKRIVAWRQEHLAEEREPVPFWLLDVRLDLWNDHKALIAAIRAQLGGQKPAAITVDTLNRGLNGNENDPKDMSKFIQAVDAIRDAFDCLVIVIHHCPLIGGRPRGHSSLSGADDVQISVEKNDDNGIITVKVVHMKDDEAGLVLAAKLKRVELCRDTKNNPITSCIIEPVEAGTAGPKLTKVQRFAFEALKKTIADPTDGITVLAESELANKGIPAGTRVCRTEAWRSRFYQTYPADKHDTKKKALFRATLDLEEAGYIGLVAEYIYLPSSGTNGTK